VPARGDWPTARGNVLRTGCVDGQSGPAKPGILWVYKSPEHFVAAPVPGATGLFVGGIGAFNTGAFHTLALAAQAPERVLWSKTAPFITRPTVCSPAFVDGLVIFGDGMHQTDDATLYCVRAEDGLPVWLRPVPGRLVHLEAPPTVDRNRVYVCGGDAGVLCLELKRVVTPQGQEQDLAAVVPALAKQWGEMLAKYKLEKQRDPQFALPPAETALPIPSPKLVWQQGQGKWHVDAPATAVGDSVLVASAFLDEEKIGRRSLLCLKAADGSVVWECPLQVNPWSGPTVAGQTVLVGCSSIRFDRKLLGQAQGEVLGIDLANGQVRWREKLPAGVLSPIAVQGETAVYTSTDGKVTARHVPTGRALWSYQAANPFFAGVAIAGDAVYAADLKAQVYSLRLADGQPRWTFNLAADPAVQSRTMVFGSPVVHGGDLYLATCNLDGEADQPSVVVCLSDKAQATAATAQPLAVLPDRRRVVIPCRIAPRKLPTLQEIYPLEVVASFPSPRGQKAHETIVTFECKPSEVHKSLESLGLKPGKPARGEEGSGVGPELRVLLEVPSILGKPREIPVERTMLDTRTGKLMPPLSWRFTGSALRQPDPNKDDKVYGADLSGTLIALFPVTDETVCQTGLTMREEGLLKLEVNRAVLPPEGTAVKLILEAK
jgi:outer membrane protein assembly factor BamB